MLCEGIRAQVCQTQKRGWKGFRIVFEESVVNSVMLDVRVRFRREERVSLTGW